MVWWLEGLGHNWWQVWDWWYVYCGGRFGTHLEAGVGLVVLHCITWLEGLGHIWWQVWDKWYGGWRVWDTFGGRCGIGVR